MTTIRVMPPSGAASTTTVANGRSYTAAPGAFLDVPDFDASILTANGWVFVASGGVGATAQRPASPNKGTSFHDSTLGLTIIFDGKTWRNHATGAQV
jgi:hypothetical protein